MNEDDGRFRAFPPPARTEPCKLYLISPQEVGGAFPDRLKAALEGGPVAAFQLRVKDVDEHELARLAEPLQRICADADVAFIVNDSMALAKRLGADGVHLGQSDGDIREARALLGPAAQIGVTCHDSRHLAMEAGEAGADYVAFGAFYPTTTKPSELPPDPAILSWWSACSKSPASRSAGSRPTMRAAGRRRRRLPRRVPGGVGQGRSGRRSRQVRGVRRLSSWIVTGTQSRGRTALLARAYFKENTLRRVPRTHCRSRRLHLYDTSRAQRPPPSPKPAKPRRRDGIERRPAAAEDKPRPLMQAQVVLDRLGFTPGVIDGKMGMSTVNAIKGFQEAARAGGTGKLDEPTTGAGASGSRFPPPGS